jgi:hypothetical protein
MLQHKITVELIVRYVCYLTMLSVLLRLYDVCDFYMKSNYAALLNDAERRKPKRSVQNLTTNPTTDLGSNRAPAFRCDTWRS